MAWIKTIEYAAAEGRLKKMYDRLKGPNDNVDNVLLIHSLRPHSLQGHMRLYKNVLHHVDNSLPKWYLEALGVYVSYLNNCDYCFEHHYAGFARLINDEIRARSFQKAVETNQPHSFFDDQYAAGSRYAEKLTLNPTKMERSDVDQLRKAGFSDGEILEINQVVSYFNYVNRTVVGLGVNTDGDVLGLSPNDNDDPNNWSHS